MFVESEELAASVRSLLGSDRYVVTQIKSVEALFPFIERNSHPDCLVLQNDSELLPLVRQLQARSAFLPAVILETEPRSAFLATAAEQSVTETADDSPADEQTFIYHLAEVKLLLVELNQISSYIDQAITQFLNLTATARLTDAGSPSDPTTELTTQSSLYRQQRRLAEKLRERLGYLGVYYKRNPQIFLRNLPSAERQKFLEQLKANYRQIVLSYFSKDPTLNNQIDEFVNLAFFADVPVTLLVEIHMELMDDFSKQLQLEGRSEEVLLDYRLTLIDVIAHLCEMYRRSIPRES
ncbi:MAG: circadian clock protein KaiA [Actinomycetota bacterium]